MRALVVTAGLVAVCLLTFPPAIAVLAVLTLPLVVNRSRRVLLTDHNPKGDN